MDLVRFLKQREIIYTLCAAALSTQIIGIADSIVTTIIVPCLNRDVDNNHAIENFTINVRGARIEFGKILIALIRVVVVILLLYLIYFIIY